MEVSKDTQAENRKWQKQSIILTTIFLVTLCGGWVYIASDSLIPIKECWIKDRSAIWFNWILPCRYYRFHSKEKVPSIAKWFIGEFRRIGAWENSMVVESTKLKKIIQGQIPNGSEETINQSVINWSTPVLGNKFAFKVGPPFILLISTKKESATGKRVVHIRISSAPEEMALIEIWDNRTYRD